MMYMVIYGVCVMLACIFLGGGWYEVSWVPADDMGEFSVFRGEFSTSQRTSKVMYFGDIQERECVVG